MAEIKKDDSGPATGCIVLVIFAVLVFFGGYEALDDAGWISHNRETIISAQPNWLVGESKLCYSTPINPQLAATLKVKAWDVTRTVNCDDGPEHDIAVRFWGRTERPEERVRYGVGWKCVKNTGSFTCKALE